jgi:RNA polymerase sigma-70 factor (ECF subfamily)
VFVVEQVGDLDELERRHVTDLYLAFGCTRGDPAALATLERQVLPVVARGVASFADAEEILQMLRERMLVVKDGRRGIGGYDGRAPLATWLRVCAARMGLRTAERQRRSAPLDDRALDQISPGVADPELSYFKQHYGARFRVAFDEALASMTPRARNLLRHSVIDGLGLDQIAAIYHIHRATAARQLKQARSTLADATRERMRLSLGITEAELESIIRMIASMTDIALRQAFARGRAYAQKTE